MRAYIAIEITRIIQKRLKIILIIYRHCRAYLKYYFRCKTNSQFMCKTICQVLDMVGVSRNFIHRNHFIAFSSSIPFQFRLDKFTASHEIHQKLLNFKECPQNKIVAFQNHIQKLKCIIWIVQRRNLYFFGSSFFFCYLQK